MIEFDGRKLSIHPSIFALIQGNTEEFPGQSGDIYISPQHVLGVASPGRHPSQMPESPLLADFNVEQ